MTDGQEKTVQCQALPEPGVSSELEVALERRFSEHILNSSIGRGKVPIGKPSTPSTKPVSSPPGLTKSGWGDVLKLCLKKATQGEGWTHMERACGPVIPGILSLQLELVWPRNVSGRYGDSVHYGDEYYFSTFIGQACTNLTGRWRALFARYF